MTPNETKIMKQFDDLKEHIEHLLQEHKTDIEALRPKADAYDAVCMIFGIKNDILGYVNKLKEQTRADHNKADAYDNVCRTLEIKNENGIDHILDYVYKLKEQIKTDHDAIKDILRYIVCNTT
jgi:hypothetical protein